MNCKSVNSFVLLLYRTYLTAPLVSFREISMAGHGIYTAGASEGEDLDELVPDLPMGPLQHYRSMASFNWKLMKTFTNPPEMIAFAV